MFDILLKDTIENNFKPGEYIIKPVNLIFSEWHETSANPVSYPFDKGFFVFKELIVIGEGLDLTQNFITLRSKKQAIDLKPLLKLDFNNLHTVYSDFFQARIDFPSVHDSMLRVEYTAAAFIFSTIYTAYLSGLLITPK